MKTIRRAYDMLKRNRKESWAYLLTLTLSATLLLLFVDIQNNTNFLSQVTDVEDPVLRTSSMVALGSVTFIITVVCAINCYVANTYFLKAKSQEICVYLSSGMNIIVLAKYLLIQNLIILSVALSIGLVSGICLNPLINLIVYRVLNISGTLFTISWTGIFAWILILSFEIFYLFLLSFGYAYKAELKDLLDESKIARIPDLRLIKMPTIIYPIITALSFVIMVCVPVNAVYFAICSIIAFCGVKGCFQRYFPKRRDKQVARAKYLRYEKIIVRGNLNVMLKNCYLYILMIFLLVVGMSCAMAKGIILSYVQVILGIAYILLLLMMCASLYFKIMLEVKKRKQDFEQLALLGMPMSANTLRTEVQKLFLYTLLFPLPFVLLICGRFYFSNQMSIGMCVFILSSFLCIIIFTSVISTRHYEGSVLEKRGGQHE